MKWSVSGSAIMGGASGYVLKQVRGNDLVSAITRVGRGEYLIDPALTKRVLSRRRSVRRRTLRRVLPQVEVAQPEGRSAGLDWD